MLGVDGEGSDSNTLPHQSEQTGCSGLFGRSPLIILPAFISIVTLRRKKRLRLQHEGRKRVRVTVRGYKSARDGVGAQASATKVREEAVVARSLLCRRQSCGR
jgi:hypothetical protein